LPRLRQIDAILPLSCGGGERGGAVWRCGGRGLWGALIVGVVAGKGVAGAGE